MAPRSRNDGKERAHESGHGESRGRSVCEELGAQSAELTTVLQFPKDEAIASVAADHLRRCAGRGVQLLADFHAALGIRDLRIDLGALVVRRELRPNLRAALDQLGGGLAFAAGLRWVVLITFPLRSWSIAR